MASLTIWAQHETKTAFSITTTGGGNPSCAFSKGVIYSTPTEVLSQLNTSLSTVVTMALSSTTGKVGLTWNDAPATLTWNDTSLRDYLGFTGDITDADRYGDTPCSGWWHGNMASPPEYRRQYSTTDNISSYGRATSTGDISCLRTSLVRLWLHRKIDVGTFADALEAAYIAAHIWAGRRITLVDAKGNYTKAVPASGWEFAPGLLDPQTAYADLEISAW